MKVKMIKNSDSLMQSIHKDLSGEIICEGHILEITQFEKPYIVEVYWDDNNCALRVRTTGGLKGFFPLENPKIIGNMSESPEKFV